MEDTGQLKAIDVDGLKLLMEQVEEERHGLRKHIFDALLEQANEEVKRLVRGTTIQESVVYWNDKIKGLKLK